ncbi:MAG TPA: hypothetical protein VGY66_21500 [Gemmataceae bacterium]|jgi:hypothetical protein|nr:hypothetical protein [Gemmataceae bacterium]
MPAILRAAVDAEQVRGRPWPVGQTGLAPDGNAVTKSRPERPEAALDSAFHALMRRNRGRHKIACAYSPISVKEDGYTIIVFIYPMRAQPSLGATIAQKVLHLLQGPSRLNPVAICLANLAFANRNQKIASHDRDQHEPGPAPEPPAFQ